MPAGAVGNLAPSPWLPFGCGPAEAWGRLFCLPFAGGGASNFTGWRKRLPGVGVAPVQYPGRETRFDEPLPLSLESLVATLADALVPAVDRPYLLFGYSMGARIAFALAHRLRSLGLPAPRALLVAAHGAPDTASSAATAVALPEAQFKRAVQAYGGLSADLLEDEEFCKLFLPVLRADFGLAVQPLALGPLDCPIYAYAGTGDTTASPATMAGWQRFTRGHFHSREFDGGHFFFRSPCGFDEALAADIAAALPAPGSAP